MKKLMIITLIMMVMTVLLFAQNPEKMKMKQDMKEEKKIEPCCPNPDMMMDKDHFKKMVKELDLSKEQVKKLEDLRTEHAKFMNIKKAQMENLQIDKRKAMMNEQFEEAKKINKQIADLQLEIENKQVDHHAAILKELKPEQKEKMKEMMPMTFGKERMEGKGVGLGKRCGMNRGQCMNMCH